MKKTTVDDVLFINNKTIIDEYASLTPIEGERDVPFPIKRIFYVSGVRDKATRGKHAHYKTKQLLICLNGRIDVICRDGEREVRYFLESPRQAVLIPEMIWDEQVYQSEDSILLSICNTNYDTEDYIHSFEKFQELKSK